MRITDRRDARLLADTRRWAMPDSMPCQRLRRWPGIDSAMAQRLAFVAGITTRNPRTFPYAYLVNAWLHP